MRISLVIPVLNESEVISGFLKSLKTIEGYDELIIVDGGSTDDTFRIAESQTDKVITSPKGRGIQLDAGWRECSGDIVWFLHADTIPPVNSGQLIKEAFTNQAVSVTAFWLKFDTKRFDMKFFEFCGNVRTFCCKAPFGDQGIAVRRKYLEKLGGIPHWQYLEDVWLVKNMRKLGKLKMLSGHTTTSPRRYLDKGILKTVYQHKKIMMDYRRFGKPVKERM